MNEFEKTIGGTFKEYGDRKIANLMFLYPPMRAAGRMGKFPCYIPTRNGKAPYDLAGYYYDAGNRATPIGVELKETREQENRLPIVGPGKDGNGLQYHQLEGLLELHNAGGVAFLLYNNGGQVGRLSGEQLAVVKQNYDASLAAEAARKEVAKGARSIAWGMFKPVEETDWLPPAPRRNCK